MSRALAAFRIYNPSIGKFLSVDPLTSSYPWYTPYQFAGNMPIWAKDLDGLEPDKVNSGKGPEDNMNATDNLRPVNFNDYLLQERVGKLQDFSTSTSTLSVGDVSIHSKDSPDIPKGNSYVPPGQSGTENVEMYPGEIWSRKVTRHRESGKADPIDDPFIFGAAGALRGVLSKCALAATRVLGQGSLNTQAAKTSTTVLRKVGSVLESVDDVMANPNLLKGKSPLQVEGILGKTPGWRIETLGQGSQKGNGWVLRQHNAKGNATGPQLRWHPGGGHHGPTPYWRVVGPNGDLGGIIR